MTPAERMRKYRACKHLRAAWERAIRAGIDPYEVMGVTPIGVTARSDDQLADPNDRSIGTWAGFVARPAGRPS